jgi:hypothetical protein
MPTLNVMTALLVGAFAAAVWAVIAIRRLLRSEGFAHLTKRQRLVVWCLAAIAFVPSLFVALLGATALTHVTLQPGPSVSLVLDLTVALGLGLFGAALTLGIGFLAAVVLRAASRRHESAV